MPEHTLSLQSLSGCLDVNEQEFEARRRPTDLEEKPEEKSTDLEARRRPEDFEARPERE